MKGIMKFIAEEMGQGVPEGRVRPLLLPLRGRLLERRRDSRGQDRREDEPQGSYPVYPRLRPTSRHRTKAHDWRRCFD